MRNQRADDGPGQLPDRFSHERVDGKTMKIYDEGAAQDYDGDVEEAYVQSTCSLSLDDVR